MMGTCLSDCKSIHQYTNMGRHSFVLPHPELCGGMGMKQYFDYLDSLRQSGETNMFGAVPYLQREFPELIDRNQAAQVLRAWMDNCQKEGGEK